MKISLILILSCLSIFSYCDSKNKPGEKVGKKFDQIIEKGEKATLEAKKKIKKQTQALGQKVKEGTKEIAEEETESLQDMAKENRQVAEKLARELTDKWQTTKKEIQDNWDAFQKEAKRQWPGLSEKEMQDAMKNLDAFKEKLEKNYKTTQGPIQKEIEQVLEKAKARNRN